MTLRDLIAGEFIDVVEWLEDSPDAMVWRFSRPLNEIKNGAQLIVRPGQVAVFVDQGTVADVFMPGRHELVTRNLPVLSRLRGWKYTFQSPFKADVVFVSSRQFPSHKWGTKTPVMLNARELGPVRLRAYGTFIVRVNNAKTFVTELVGSNSGFAIEQIADQVRDMIVARFAEQLGEDSIPILELASRYTELGDLVAKRLGTDLTPLGLELTRLVVESIALPDEVAATLDQRTRIELIGDVGAYAALQAADAVRDAARNQGTGGAGAAVGVGMAMAGQLANAGARALNPTAATPAVGGPPSVPGPPPIPQGTGFFIAVDGKPQGPFDDAALRARVADKSLTAGTLVWRQGMAQWAAAGTVPEVAALI
ncbi:MAG TPA: SPFH domain-containing protein [Gemmatimonadaceae bacterium]